jgi:hypothetical protein
MPRTLRVCARLVLLVCAIVIAVAPNASAVKTAQTDCRDWLYEWFDSKHYQMVMRLEYSAQQRLYYGAMPDLYKYFIPFSEREPTQEHGWPEGPIYRIEYGDPIIEASCRPWLWDVHDHGEHDGGM